MSGIRFITNTAWRDCAGIYSDTDTVADGDLNNLIGGPLHLGAKWMYTYPSAYHFGYVDVGNFSLAADCFMWAGGASDLDGSSYSIYKSTASGVSAIDPNEAGSTWNTGSVTLVGKLQDDIVFTFSEITNADGYLFGPTNPMYTGEWASLIYFGKSCLWDFPVAATVESANEAILVSGEVYEVDRRITLSFEGVTRADLTAFEAQHKIYEQPVGIYDELGNRFPEKLILGIISAPLIQPQFDDLFSVTLPIAALRRYPRVLR